MTHFFSPFFSANDLTLPSKSSSSLRKQTKLQIFLSCEAWSIFLTKLVKLPSMLRAKIIATGSAPYCQTRQFFLPALSPVTFSGWKGVGLLPTCNPDLRGSPATTVDSATAVRAKAPSTIHFLIEVPLSRKTTKRTIDASDTGFTPRTERPAD